MEADLVARERTSPTGNPALARLQPHQPMVDHAPVGRRVADALIRFHVEQFQGKLAVAHQIPVRSARAP